MKPLVTVLLPCYNCQDYLREAIKSVLNQTLTNFEFIIINDGSIDNSENIIKSYKDKRLLYFKNRKNIGLTKSLNKGLKLAKGKYIARMDADDICLKDRLKTQFDFMEKNKNVVLCSSRISKIGIVKDDVFQIKFCRDNTLTIENFVFKSIIVHSTTFFRRKIIDKHKLKYGMKYDACEDYYLWSKLIEYGNFVVLGKRLLKYRVHSKQISVNKKFFQLNNTYLISLDILKRGNIKLSDEEKKLYKKIVLRNYSNLSKSSLNKISALFNKIFINSKFDKDKMRVVLKNKWFEIFINNKNLNFDKLNLYLNSDFRNRSFYKNLVMFKKVIFR